MRECFISLFRETINTQERDDSPIAQATVKLYDQTSGTLVAETKTDFNGQYVFENIVVSNYKLIVDHEEYLETEVNFYALPEFGEDEVVVDVELSKTYQITLTANPSSILGNGTSSTRLTAIVTDHNGTTVPGVDATFTVPADKGTFTGGHHTVTVQTDENGTAEIDFTSAYFGGTTSVRFPVTFNVNDPVKDLSAQTQIIITMEPGAIIGQVTETTTDKRPVAGAVIEVTNEEIGFYARYVTGLDGKYTIGVPVGEVDYQVLITKPVEIGGVIEHVSFPQVANVGLIPGDQHKSFPASLTGSGLLLKQGADGKPIRFSSDHYQNMDGFLLAEDKQTKIPVTVLPNGTFYAQNLPEGKYELFITMAATDDTGQPRTLTLSGGNTIIDVSADGEMNIVTELVDPYGEVRNIETQQLIESAEVTLYYWNDPADPKWNDPSNEVNWEKVTLPMLADFPPFDNLSPTQVTDEEGFYAWMVYPETSYFIVAKADGYYDYISDIIPVEWDIVRHDIWMTPIPKPAPGPGPGMIVLPPPGDTDPDPDAEPEEEVKQNTGRAIDLAIDISVDQRSYMEESRIEMTIDYMNRSSLTASDVLITLELPDNTSVVELNGGMLSEDGAFVTWELGQLEPHVHKQLTVILQAGKMDRSEQKALAKAAITSNDKLINLEDDISTLELMFFSNDYGVFTHQRYIVGYPDGEFKPNRNITRAEIANIFARILQLRPYVQHETMYSDVPQGMWYTDGIEAATRLGLFTGYVDGSFKPDQPITRAELTYVIGKFLELEDRPPVMVNFSDITGHWAANMIENVRRNRVAEGYLDGTFKPNNHLVRSEAVTLINRMLYRGPLHGVDASYSDVLPGHWALGDVEESTLSHEAIRNLDSSEQFMREIETDLGF